MTRRRAAWWWAAFAATVVVCLVFSLALGDHLSRLRVPVALGSSGLGEWAVMADHGLAIRVDSAQLAESLPSQFDPNQPAVAPNGMRFLQVRATVRLDSREDSCNLELINTRGERLTQTGFGVAGPEPVGCLFLSSTGETLQPGGEFESQMVFLVPPSAITDYSLRVLPVVDNTKEQPVYWTVALS